MNYKPGDIIFLTRRHKKPFYRIFISYGIAVFTKKKEQTLNEVKVHSAIIYKDDNVLKVRDMDKNGDEHYTFEKYTKKYAERMEVVRMPFVYKSDNLFKFNYTCKHLRVKYDYSNTFFFQVLKRIFGRVVFIKSNFKRMCAEDVQRQFNILKPGFFKTPEATNPNELYFLILNLNK